LRQSLFDGELARARGRLVPLILLGLAAALLSGRRRLALFTTVWFVPGYGGLVLNYRLSPLRLHWYVVTSANRIVATLVIGGAALAPLLAAETWSVATG
jgi:hypothetical protein